LPKRKKKGAHKWGGIYLQKKKAVVSLTERKEGKISTTKNGNEKKKKMGNKNLTSNKGDLESRQVQFLAFEKQGEKREKEGGFM